MSRFVDAGATDVLQISNNETLIVKRRLNRGDKADMYLRMGAPGELGVGTDQHMERVFAYLLDWTVTDGGRPVPYRDLDRKGRIDTLRNLDDDDFQEIKDAIDKHIADVGAAREAEKKARAGAQPSSQKSTSVDGSTSPSAVQTP
jgi:hypothetical protein